MENSETAHSHIDLLPFETLEKVLLDLDCPSVFKFCCTNTEYRELLFSPFVNRLFITKYGFSPFEEISKEFSAMCKEYKTNYYLCKKVEEVKESFLPFEPKVRLDVAYEFIKIKYVLGLNDMSLLWKALLSGDNRLRMGGVVEPVDFYFDVAALLAQCGLVEELMVMDSCCTLKLLRLCAFEQENGDHCNPFRRNQAKVMWKALMLCGKANGKNVSQVLRLTAKLFGMFSPFKRMRKKTIKRLMEIRKEERELAEHPEKTKKPRTTRVEPWEFHKNTHKEIVQGYTNTFSFLLFDKKGEAHIPKVCWQNDVRYRP